MTLLAANPTATAEIAAAAVLGFLAVYLLLPRPKGRSVLFGTFLGVAALAVFGLWLAQAFAPAAGHWVEAALFGLFSTMSLVFGGVLVTQRNPARGAIAFAFVILSVCGLFLLLAAPFLMAATIIIYAGAIIVTFLFVIMLSQQTGFSSENDRSREPLLGSLAGFAFLGLLLFALQHSTAAPATPAKDYGIAPPKLPMRPLTDGEHKLLADIADALKSDNDKLNLAGLADLQVLLHNLEGRLRDVPTREGRETLDRVKELRAAADRADNNLLAAEVKPDARKQLDTVREQVVVLNGTGRLPARNVAAVGYALYSDHLLAVEMAGTLLLVATIGAVAIAGRKGAPA